LSSSFSQSSPFPSLRSPLVRDSAFSVSILSSSSPSTFAAGAPRLDSDSRAPEAGSNNSRTGVPTLVANPDRRTCASSTSGVVTPAFVLSPLDLYLSPPSLTDSCIPDTTHGTVNDAFGFLAHFERISPPARVDIPELKLMSVIESGSASLSRVLTSWNPFLHNPRINGDGND